MRRNERKVSCLQEIENIIRSCDVIRLGLVDEGKAYIVPLNFAYTLSPQGIFSFYFHSAPEGRKIGILKNSPHVSFELDHLISLGKNEVPCKWTTYFESVMGEGKITFLTENKEKITALELIMEKHGFEGTPNFPSSMLNHIQVYRLDVTEFSAKRNLPPSP